MADVPATYRLELRRIAVELQSFPFIPRKMRFVMRGRTGVRTANGWLNRTEHGRHGCLVYHDIIAQGGHGTRRQVLRVAEGLVAIDMDPLPATELLGHFEAPEALATAVATQIVAGFHAIESTLVSTPELPLETAHFYRPSPFPNPEHLHVATTQGEALRAMLLDRQRAWRIRLRNHEDDLVARAREVWREALLWLEDDTPAYLAEREQLTQLARVVGGALRTHTTKVRTTRLITLED